MSRYSTHSPAYGKRVPFCLLRGAFHFSPTCFTNPNLGGLVRILMFYHSLLSDWNHGNAHFLRGVATELISRGHEVRIFEPENSWSLTSLIAEHGEKPVRKFRSVYPRLSSIRYGLDSFALETELEQAD